MTLVANVLTSQFSDWIEQLERIVLIGSCVFLFLGYVAESKNSWAPGRKSIGSLGGGGEGGGLWGWITKYSGGIKGGSGYKSTANEGEGDCKNITEPYKGIR